MTATLPILRVRTAHSEYVIDQNNGTLTRKRQHEDANDLGTWGIGDNIAVPYDKIMSDLKLGDRLVVTYPTGAYTISTPILEVEEL